MDLTLNPSAMPNTRFAIAYSGGGDSTALLHAARDKNPLVLIVDHGLRAGSAAEAKVAKAFAEALGLQASVLSWQPPPLSGGVQGRARSARYGLLGEACRAAGLSYLLTGHTEDDQAETVLMRLKADGSWRGAAAMRGVTPSPLWPQLAGVSVCRPMLSLSRAQIRAYLAAHNLPYVDDPSNENRRFARIRARDALGRNPLLRRDMLALCRDMSEGRTQERKRYAQNLRDHVTEDDFGNLFLPVIPSPHFLGYLIRAVSGTSTAPRQAELCRLVNALRESDFRGASLGGAVISAQKTSYMISRDPVIASGRTATAPLAPAPFSGRTLWDGRFWIDGKGTLAPAGKEWAHAPAPMKQALKLCPAPARAALPIWIHNEQIVAIGPIGRDGQRLASVKSAVLPRLERAFGPSRLEPK